MKKDVRLPYYCLCMAVGIMYGDVYAEYISFKKIHPGQIRYASMNVTEKMNNAIKTGNAELFYDPANKSFRFKFMYNNGTSILSEKNALPVIKSPFGYVLVDGHHDLLASVALGADFIPVRVVGDLSNLTPDQFWLQAEKQGLVYPYAIGGIRQIPPASFKNLVDDSNRYFAALVARKCEKYGDAATISRGADYPLWIKIGKDIPFIEFMIADAWWNNGLVYSYDMGNNPSAEFVEKAREILNKAAIKGLKIIKQREHYLAIENLCELSS